MLDALEVRPEFSHAGSSESAGRTAEALLAGPAYWHRRPVLFLLRDPRDTALSAYYQATRRARVFDDSLPEFLRDPRFGMEKIIRFHLLWLDSADRFPAFLPLQYEAFRSDTAEALARAAAFLAGRPPEPAAVAAAVAAGSFERMRRLELSGAGADGFGVSLTPGDPSDPESYKTRRGLVGGWREAFTPEDRAFAQVLLSEQRYSERLAAAGLAFER